MFNVCRDAMKHRGELTWSGDISRLARLLIKIITGDGCTILRQEVVKRKFASEATFEWMMRELRKGFKDHSEGLRQELGDVVSKELDAVRDTLDIVREANVAEESERDPEFRQHVAGEVARARSLMGI